MPLCLLVEDDASHSRVLSAALRSEEYQTLGATSAEAAILACREHRPEVILLDLGLPDRDGLDLIPDLLAESPLSRIVVLTGRNSVSAAVAALRSGARHYLVKPWDVDELLLVIGREARAVDAAEGKSRAAGPEVFWGTSVVMTRLLNRLARIARSPMTPVLLEGETGVGKEVVARELHRQTALPGTFVALNCASVPSELLESELFGHEKGAFTGADARRRGLAEIARDGTLFLDEIGEMPVSLQPKLLRFLQDFAFRRVGGSEELVSPCRIITATHRNLESMQLDGRFREDLFFRLAVVRLRIPPLRERSQDLLSLAHFLLEQVAAATGSPVRPLAPDAERALAEHHFRGNVRELRNRLERALVLAEEDAIRAYDLDLPEQNPSSVTSNARSDPDGLRAVLEECDWNISRAAARLGRPRHWLRYRIKKLGLERPESFGRGS